MKKLLIAGAAISLAALSAVLVRGWLPALARVATRVSKSVSSLRGKLPTEPPRPTSITRPPEGDVNAVTLR